MFKLHAKFHNIVHVFKWSHKSESESDRFAIGWIMTWMGDLDWVKMYELRQTHVFIKM